MQHMNSEICANTAEGTTKQLIDSRDGNSYWVAKMKDGNCWMTQNLALDITEKGLSAMDTDIEYDWNSRSVHPPKNTISEYSGKDFFTTSYNLDKMFMLSQWSQKDVVEVLLLGVPEIVM